MRPGSPVRPVDPSAASEPDAAGSERAEQLDQALDEALAATFPASDPVALSGSRPRSTRASPALPRAG